MVEFRDLAAETLTWHRASGWFHPRYVLRHGEREIGSLEFEKGWRSPALLKMGESVWHLQGRGLSRNIGITDAAGEELGIFHQGFFRLGTVELADAPSIECEGPRLFSRTVSFTDSGGSTLATLRPRGLGRRCEVELSPSGAAHPQAGLLVGIGWYAIILRQRDAAASS